MNSDSDLVAAFAGAWAVFMLTDSWDATARGDTQAEVTQGKRMIQAALDARVEVIIYSGGPVTDPVEFPSPMCNGQFMRPTEAGSCARSRSVAFLADGDPLQCTTAKTILAEYLFAQENVLSIVPNLGWYMTKSVSRPCSSGPRASAANALERCTPAGPSCSRRGLRVTERRSSLLTRSTTRTVAVSAPSVSESSIARIKHLTALLASRAALCWLAVPMVSAPDDTGPIVLGLLKDPERYRGKTFFLASEWLTLPEIAAGYSRGPSPRSWSSFRAARTQYLLPRR